MIAVVPCSATVTHLEIENNVVEYGMQQAEVYVIRPHPEDRSGTGYHGAVGVMPV